MWQSYAGAVFRQFLLAATQRGETEPLQFVIKLRIKWDMADNILADSSERNVVSCLSTPSVAQADSI